jgi:hypothetical protein
MRMLLPPPRDKVFHDAGRMRITVQDLQESRKISVPRRQGRGPALPILVIPSPLLMMNKIYLFSSFLAQQESIRMA